MSVLLALAETIVDCQELFLADFIGAHHGGDRDARIASLLTEKQPSRWTSDPSEIGMLVAWLCDSRVHNITGATIPVDGGWTAQ